MRVMPELVYKVIMEFKASNVKLEKAAVDSSRKRFKRRSVEAEPIKYISKCFRLLCIPEKFSRLLE